MHWALWSDDLQRRSPDQRDWGPHCAGRSSSGVLWMVLRESLVLLGIGIALGVPAMLAACQAVRAGLFGVGAWDVTTLVVAVLIIGAVTVVAAYFPARRATKVDPIVALRYE